MNAILNCFVLFLLLCVLCSMAVGMVWAIIGTLFLLGQVIMWLAYIGLGVIVLSAIGWILAKIFS